MASDRFAILSKGREMVQLAPQQMLACVRRQQGCSGGHLDTAWQYLRRTGYALHFRVTFAVDDIVSFLPVDFTVW